MTAKHNTVIILQECDGWEVQMPNGKVYRWNHNDEDLGTEGISAMLKDMGWDVEVEESY